jgi:phenylacetate-CoA ligase
MKAYQMKSGRKILNRLDELSRTQWWSRPQLLALQRDRLRKLLVYSYQYIPYYRRLFDQAGFQPDEVLTDLARLRKIPLLNKSIIRENFDDIVTTQSRIRSSSIRRTTGGSTGEPLMFLADPNFRDYFTADVHRHLSWGGWKFGQPHAYLGGTAFEVSQAQSLRACLENWTLNRFSTNAYVLSEESMRAFSDKIRIRHPRLLYGYASSLYHFAKFVRNNALDDIKFQAVSSSSEVLYPQQRQFIEETFGCKVLDRYASLELGAIGSQCEALTGLHTSVESVFIEILNDDGRPMQPGEPGNIVVTNLNNYAMPFIRYCIEDIGAWRIEQVCPCGRMLPMLELIQGRRVDMFKTKDGRTVWGGLASPLFAIKGVKQFQVVQKSLDLVLIRIVKEGELDSAKLDAIEQTIKAGMGNDVEVRFEFPDKMSILNSGKYRYAISEINGLSL